MDDSKCFIMLGGIVITVVLGMALLVGCNAVGCGEAIPRGFVSGGPLSLKAIEDFMHALSPGDGMCKWCAAFNPEVFEETQALCAAELALDTPAAAPDIKSIPGDVVWFSLFGLPDAHTGDVLLFGGWAVYDKKHPNATQVLTTDNFVVDTDVCTPRAEWGTCRVVYESYHPIRVLNASIPDGGRVIHGDKVVVCGVFEGVGDGIGYDGEPIVRALVLHIEGQT